MRMRDYHEPINNIYSIRRFKQVDIFYVTGRPIFSSRYDDIQTYVQLKNIKKRKILKKPPMRF
tara:strand:- start:1280 stop:1468 length:189 start_codon:yes stop_codon:yes gene_type:complete